MTKIEIRELFAEEFAKFKTELINEIKIMLQGPNSKAKKKKGIQNEKRQRLRQSIMGIRKIKKSELR
jgi:hypothetical protein